MNDWICSLSTDFGVKSDNGPEMGQGWALCATASDYFVGQRDLTQL